LKDSGERNNRTLIVFPCPQINIAVSIFLDLPASIE
jgi:hypothetical protein